MICNIKSICLIATLVGIAQLAACSQVNYVERGNEETVGSNTVDPDPLNRNVDYHLSRAFYETPPDCTMILPISVPEKANAKVSYQVEDAVNRHLNGYLDRVIGARRIRNEVRKRALDLNQPGDRIRLARALHCEFYLEIETAGVDTIYVVVWANVSIKIRMTLKRVKDDQVLWSGAHTAERMDGSLPISLLGAGVGIFSAGRLAGDQDAISSIIDDSLRRTLASLPDMRRY